MYIMQMIKKTYHPPKCSYRDMQDYILGEWFSVDL